MKKIIILSAGLITLSSCVSKRIYNELDEKYAECSKELSISQRNFDFAISRAEDAENKNKAFKTSQLNNQKALYDLETKYRILENRYNNLEQNTSTAIQAELTRLNAIRQDLNEKAKRVEDLERLLNKQNQQLNTLKQSLSKALFDFKGNGLSVEQKNGKVYIMMENKLLFKSGSWSVSNEGKQAVQKLGNVLANNPDIAILIEGHTDNDKIVGSLGDGIYTNWDLSTKRATAIVHLLEQTPRIDKKNLTAAGRSEFAPVTNNLSDYGKAKNRRIEVILTPRLDKISKILNETR